MENIYEQFFFLKYSGGWSFTEAYNLPIGLREWFVNRLIRQLEAEKEAMEDASSGNGPSSQTLTAQNQPQAPPNFGGPGKTG
jgi:hypothetical protein|tara:strand:+ start:2202 stop:2447 length:246 start_codon:yes stop_codon:yes gene_type:complete